jgi:uncharacterized protein (TIGR02271 family)
MQTIIAAFDDVKTARQAIEQLVQQGFSRESVHLQSGQDSDKASSTAKQAQPGDPFGFFNFFSTLMGGASTDQAGNYAEAVQRGSAVVVADAQTDEEIEKATTLLQQLGVVDVDQRAEQWKSEGWKGHEASAKPSGTKKASTEEETVMPVVQEELKVGKRTVQGGGIRVVRRVSETPVSQLVKLREEHATIERRPVEREATAADLEQFKEGTIEVRERSQEAVVGKTTHVVEEVVVGKQVSERTQKVSDTVRRTDVEVEQIAGEKPATGEKKPVSSKR